MGTWDDLFDSQNTAGRSSLSGFWDDLFKKDEEDEKTPLEKWFEQHQIKGALPTTGEYAETPTEPTVASELGQVGSGAASGMQQLVAGVPQLAANTLETIRQNPMGRFLAGGDSSGVATNLELLRGTAQAGREQAAEWAPDAQTMPGIIGSQISQALPSSAIALAGSTAGPVGIAASSALLGAGSAGNFLAQQEQETGTSASDWLSVMAALGVGAGEIGSEHLGAAAALGKAFPVLGSLLKKQGVKSVIDLVESSPVLKSKVMSFATKSLAEGFTEGLSQANQEAILSAQGRGTGNAAGNIFDATSTGAMAGGPLVGMGQFAQSMASPLQQAAQRQAEQSDGYTMERALPRRLDEILNRQPGQREVDAGAGTLGDTTIDELPAMAEPVASPEATPPVQNDQSDMLPEIELPRASAAGFTSTGEGAFASGAGTTLWGDFKDILADAVLPMRQFAGVDVGGDIVKRWIRSNRAMPQAVFEVIQKMDTIPRARLMEAADVYDRFNRLVPGVATDSKETEANLRKKVNDFLVGDAEMPVGADTELGKTVTEMRDHIDDLTNQSLEAGIFTERQAPFVRAMIGSYMHRSYEAHSPLKGFWNGNAFRNASPARRADAVIRQVQERDPLLWDSAVGEIMKMDKVTRGQAEQQFRKMFHVEPTPEIRSDLSADTSILKPRVGWIDQDRADEAEYERQLQMSSLTEQVSGLRKQGQREMDSIVGKDIAQQQLAVNQLKEMRDDFIERQGAGLDPKIEIEGVAKAGLRNLESQISKAEKNLEKLLARRETLDAKDPVIDSIKESIDQAEKKLSDLSGLNRIGRQWGTVDNLDKIRGLIVESRWRKQNGEDQYNLGEDAHSDLRSVIRDVMKDTELPETIRKALGEHTDPAANFLTTAHAIQTVLAKKRGYDQFAKIGIAQGWLQPDKRAGVIPDSTENGIPSVPAPKGPNWTDVTINGKKYWIDSSVKTYVMGLDMELRGVMANYGKVILGSIVKLESMTKASATILSQAGQIRNLNAWYPKMLTMGLDMRPVAAPYAAAASWAMSKATGGKVKVDPLKMIAASKNTAARIGMGLQLKILSGQELTPAEVSLRSFLIEEEVMDTGSIFEFQEDLGQLQSAQRTSDVVDPVRDFIEHSDGAKKIPAKVWEVAKKAWAFGDDAPKTYAFMGMIEQEGRRHKLSDETIRSAMEDWDKPVDATVLSLRRRAAGLIRNVTPTYSRLPPIIRFLRKTPGIAAFPSFDAEIWRTTKNWTLYQAKYRMGGKGDPVWLTPVVNEMGQVIRPEVSNPHLVVAGSKTAAGMMLGGIIPGGLGFLGKAAIHAARGDDDEEQDKATKWYQMADTSLHLSALSPEWAKYQSKMYLGSNMSKRGGREDLVIDYVDMGYSTMWSQMASVVRAGQQRRPDAGVTTTLGDVAGQALDSYTDPSILGTAVGEAAQGRRWFSSWGGESSPLFAGNDANAAGLRALWVAKSVTPKVLKDYLTIASAANIPGVREVFPNPKEKDAGWEMMGQVLGLRPTTISVRQRVGGALHELSSLKREGAVVEGRAERSQDWFSKLAAGGVQPAWDEVDTKRASESIQSAVYFLTSSTGMTEKSALNKLYSWMRDDNVTASRDLLELLYRGQIPKRKKAS